MFVTAHRNDFLEISAKAEMKERGGGKMQP